MSNGVARLRVLLTELQTELGRSALERPADTSSFGYGKACGQYQAITQALDIIASIDDEEKQRERAEISTDNPTF